MNAANCLAPPPALDARPRTTARWNPFRAERLEALGYRAPGFAWEPLLDQLTADPRQFRGAIVGPKGHGKTTLVEQAAERLRHRGLRARHLRVDPSDEVTQAPAIIDGELLLLDGTETWSAWRWWRFERHARGRCGLLVSRHHATWGLPVVHRCHTSEALLGELVEELLRAEVSGHNAASGREGHRPAAVSRVALAELFRQHHGDVRACLRALYDAWASGAFVACG